MDTMNGHAICSVDWDEVVRVLSALLTPAIGLLTALIAWQQYRTNSNQFRLTLLARRVTVLNATREFIAKAIGQGNVHTADLDKFLQETRESDFLFGSDITQYLKQLYDNGVNLHTLRATQNPPNAAAHARAIAQAQSGFSGQDAEAIKKFGKYMAFKRRAA